MLDHDVGFLWHIVSGASYKLTGNKKSRTRNLFAAATLFSRFNVDGNYIKAWNGDDKDGRSIIDCLMNLFDSLMKGDGNKDGSRYTTVSKQLADDFTELLLKLGMCGTVDKEVYKGSEIYRVRICKNLNPSFGLPDSKN